MPKPRAPYLRKEITRHGRIVWYVRKTGQKRTRLRAPYGTDEFEREYAAAAGGAPVQVVRTLTWLVDQYRASSAWLSLSLATRRQRENIFRTVLDLSGGCRIATFAANNGATVAELEAIFGWSGGGMASLYTRAADRVRLARAAATKLMKPKAAPSEPEGRT